MTTNLGTVEMKLTVKTALTTSGVHSIFGKNPIENFTSHFLVEIVVLSYFDQT